MCCGILRFSGVLGAIVALIVVVIALLKQLIALVGFLLAAVKIAIVVIFIALLVMIVLAIFRDHPVLERNRVLAQRLAARLTPLAAHAHVAEVRQTGMIAALNPSWSMDELIEKRLSEAR